MTTILYNPLSANGKTTKYANKLAKKLRKKESDVTLKDITTIDNVQTFLNEIPEDHKIIICGGDGTIHRIINTIDTKGIKHKVFMSKGGTGNDFINSLPGKEKTIEINQYLQEYPKLETINGSINVINGAGMGIDGLVCLRVNRSKTLKNRSNYFYNSLVGFMRFKSFNVRLVVDGEETNLKKVWLASAMYGSCFGGGMKIAAGKKRNDGLVQLVVCHGAPKWFLFLILPSIYLGWHKRLRCVKVYNAKKIEVFSDKPTYLQADGETQYPISYYKMTI